MIRPIESRDVDSILAVQSLCPEIAQWTAWDYSRVARGDMAGWVANQENVITGFLVARRIAGDLEILNFAVQPNSRRRGLGAALLQQAFAWGKEFGAEKSLLEVRESNFAALRFYEKHGFEVVGRRSRYYVSPIEDALVLAATMK